MSKNAWWVVGAVVVAVGCSSQQAEAQEPLQFPSSVAGLETRQQQMQRFERDDDTVEQRAEAAAQLSEAYGGAEASSEAYADESLMDLITVYAVDASTPKLWSPQANDVIAEQLRLPEPPERIERSGDAECLVDVRSLAPNSTGPTRPDTPVLHCQGVRGDLTVLIPAVGPNVEPELALQVVEGILDHFRPS